MNRQLCIALHDVAPATWPQCQRILQMLDALGAAPITLLVVPDWHDQGRIDIAPDFLRAIHSRVARGDEVALHGYTHRDDAPPPGSLRDWCRRRVLTAGEGEFAELSCEEAQQRLRDGLDLLRGQGWRVEGFVPPAWLAGAGAREAVRRSGLAWTSTHTALYRFTQCGADISAQRIAAPCLTASSRTPWRRRLSRAWLRFGTQWLAQAPLLRIGLHPQDAEHADLMSCWREVIAHLIAQLEVVTKSQAVSARLQPNLEMTQPVFSGRTH